jgi:uncharacterized membrane protein
MNSALFLLLICGLLIIVALVLFLPTKRSRTKANIRADRHPPFAVFRDDDRYWYGGFLYNNPDDPDPFVPKRFGFGYTPNFGHPVGKLFLVSAAAAAGAPGGVSPRGPLPWAHHLLWMSPVWMPPVAINN